MSQSFSLLLFTKREVAGSKSSGPLQLLDGEYRSVEASVLSANLLLDADVVVVVAAAAAAAAI